MLRYSHRLVVTGSRVLLSCIKNTHIISRMTGSPLMAAGEMKHCKKPMISFRNKFNAYYSFRTFAQNTIVKLQIVRFLETVQAGYSFFLNKTEVSLFSTCSIEFFFISLFIVIQELCIVLLFPHNLRSEYRLNEVRWVCLLFLSPLKKISKIWKSSPFLKRNILCLLEHEILKFMI